MLGKSRAALRRRALYFEAALWLVFARLALRVVPFARLAPLFEKPARRRELSGPARQQTILAVRRAVFRSARILPGRTVCFPRGIAAQAMLRRRGISTTLIYGAATLPNQGLTGHVWVMDGDDGVIGHMKASEYRVLARYGTHAAQR